MTQPRVGVGVIVVKDNKVLVGKRKGSHGEGHWGFPGGHLEFNEEIEDCVHREVSEETGLTVANVRDFTFTNDIFEEKHYLTLYMLADHHSGEAEVKEPHKCEEWRWVSWADLPEPLFKPIQNLLTAGKNPFE